MEGLGIKKAISREISFTHTRPLIAKIESSVWRGYSQNGLVNYAEFL